MMRTLSDRIRHTLLFELFALIISAPLAAWLTGHEVGHIGALAIILSVLAMSWNLLYNWLFDLLERRYAGNPQRRLSTRIYHAIGFEAGLLPPGLLLVAWWLNIGLWEAFLLDAGFMLFFLGYAFVFNWLYDRAFPLPAADTPPAPASTPLTDP